MTLARKLATRILVLIIGLAVLGGVSLWGLMGLRRHFDQAQRDYEQLRAVYAVGYFAATAQGLLVPRYIPVSHNAALQHIDSAREKIDALTRSPGDQFGELTAARQATLRQIAGHLERARGQLAGGPPPAPTMPELQMVLVDVATLTKSIQDDIVANRAAASVQFRNLVLINAAVLAVLMAAAVWTGVQQYRSVMRPIRNLEGGLRRMATADFSQPVDTQGDREFKQLAEHANEMARELETLYRNLEQQVELRSGQLLRSNRLASVGLFAAGFAHEVNNPLSIIAGHAEAALRRMERAGETDDPDEQKLRDTLAIVRDEAFRCKEIIERLLDLSRAEGGERQRLDPGPVVERVATMMGGMPNFAKRRVEVQLDHGDGRILADEMELTQVLINLLANGLEAVADDTGAVRVETKTKRGWMVLTVSDNGRGFDPAVTRDVFEPFFTQRPRGSERGTGLGLTVVHAIVEKHGGRIAAQSEGTDQGSTFTIEWPKAGE